MSEGQNQSSLYSNNFSFPDPTFFHWFFPYSWPSMNGHGWQQDPGFGNPPFNPFNMQSNNYRASYVPFPDQSFDQDEGEIVESAERAQDMNQHAFNLNQKSAQPVTHDPSQPPSANKDHGAGQQSVRSPEPNVSVKEKSAAERQHELRAKLLASRGNTPRRDKNPESGKMTPVPEVKQHQPPQTTADETRRPSSTDVDGLVEQGKAAAQAAAAAANQSKPKNSTNLKSTNAKTNGPKIGNGSDTKQTKTPVGDPKIGKQSQQTDPAYELAQYEKIRELSSRYPKHTSPKEKSQTPAAKLRIELAPPAQKAAEAESPTKHRNEQNRYDSYRPSQQSPKNETSRSKSYDLARSQEPKTLPTNQPSSRPEVASPTVEMKRKQVEEPTISADLNSSYHADLAEWLELTGYHDKAYRERSLTRQRKLRDLRAQAAQLEEEARMESEGAHYMFRSQSVQPRESMQPAPPAFMPPPPVPEKYRDATTRLQHRETDVVLSRSAAESYAQNHPMPYDNHKRQPSPTWGSPSQTQGKTRRLDDAEYYVRDRPDRRSSPHRRVESARISSPPRDYQRSARSSSPRSELPLERRVTGPMNRNHNGFDPHEIRGDLPADNGRRYDNRDHFKLEGDRYAGYNKDERAFAPKGPLNLRDGGVRYFMIKSWNHDNVAEAQHSGVWATQEKNSDLFRDAFQACRHVILVFSVNNSKAFQGYARMTSVPGSAPTPPWVKGLHWATSPPFRIYWCMTGSVHFSKVGHLKNSYNEGHSVIVGRDGQEIEEECGRRLCEELDAAASAGEDSWWS